MTTDIDTLTARLARTLDSLDGDRASVQLLQPLLRLLARGEPVSIEALAAATGHTVDKVRETLAKQPDTEYDAVGRIIGYGMTMKPTPHRFEVGGRTLYTWCALDTLVFPAVIGVPADVTSPCRATGEPVHLTVEPDHITGLEPSAAVISLVTPDQCTSVRTAFCDQVHFFTSRDTATEWLSDHPGGTVMDVRDAFTVGQRLIQPPLGGAEESACC
ncbi:organomercurial lyase MerB [Nocardiopsis rhodophaea]|uniref:organomercurial lyase MerB n=1 Tax=Nocardiopsis rhodophaea TaxID=280238 RepID=UPI0031D7C0B7